MKFKNLLAQSLAWRSVYYISLLILNIIISRHLMADGAGRLFYLTNLIAFIQLFLGLTLENSLTYFGASGKITSAALFWFSLCWCVLIGIILFLLTFLSAARYSFFKDSFFYAFTYIIGLTLANFMSAMFYVKKNFFLPSILSSLLNLALGALIIMSGNALDEKIIQLYFGLFISHGLLTTVAYTFYDKKVYSISLPSYQDTKNLLRFALLSLTANIVFFLVYRIDYWFVKNSPVCTAVDLGNYIQASKLGQMLLIVPQIIASVIFPQTASGFERETVNNTITIISRLFSQCFLLLLIISLFVGKWFFPFVFGYSFTEMYWPFIFLLPGIFSLSVLTLLSAYFSGKGKIKVNIAGAFFSLLLVAVGNYFFIPVYGINAAAIISTVGYSAGMLYSMYCFYKDYKVNFAGFFKWRLTDYYWLMDALKKK